MMNIFLHGLHQKYTTKSSIQPITPNAFLSSSLFGYQFSAVIPPGSYNTMNVFHQCINLAHNKFDKINPDPQNESRF